MGVSPELLAIMQCPACGGELEETGDELVCQQCLLRYPVVDGIPVMLVEEAKRPEEDRPPE